MILRKNFPFQIFFFFLFVVFSSLQLQPSELLFAISLAIIWISVSYECVKGTTEKCSLHCFRIRISLCCFFSSIRQILSSFEILPCAFPSAILVLLLAFLLKISNFTYVAEYLTFLMNKTTYLEGQVIKHTIFFKNLFS